MPTVALVRAVLFSLVPAPAKTSMRPLAHCTVLPHREPRKSIGDCSASATRFAFGPPGPEDRALTSPKSPCRLVIELAKGAGRKHLALERIGKNGCALSRLKAQQEMSGKDTPWDSIPSR